ncbi:glycoside hydrolase family protein [Sporobolomyces salmoneus]|uniref:glycoside hydrolase family protein n=1 Tax=Sporobolomyces salmoneus TaxID=183962 RepID=UPI00317A3DC1
MTHRNSHSSTRPPPSDDDDLEEDPSSDSSSPYSTDSSDSETGLHEKESLRRHSGSVKSRKKDNSSTWIVILGVLVVVTAAIAAYFYVEKEGNGFENLIGGDESSAAITSSSTSLRGGGTSEGSGGGESGLSKTASASSTKSSGGHTNGNENETPSSTTADSIKPTGALEGKEDTNSTSSKDASSSPTTSGQAPASPSDSSTGSGSLRCRKGVGYNKAPLTQQLDICWAYNWDSTGGGLKDGVMYVPMLWGTKKLEGWEAAADKAIQQGATHILGFNEPDLAEQANLSPSEAASIWSSAMQPLATKNVKLVSPAVSNGVLTDDGKPMGVPWLKEFFDECTGCTIDAVALHWYDSASNLEYFKKYLEEAHTDLSKPIWLTEFMGTGSAKDQVSFISAAVEWLEDQDYIEAYAAFGDFCDNEIANFVDCDGKPNDLGLAYSSAT